MRIFVLFLRFIRTIIIGGLFISLLLPFLAAAPTWWTTRGVIIPGKASDDYAAINQGQLKKLTASAVAEMNAKLIGGAGTALNSLVAGWSTGVAEADDYAVVTIGQLKAIAKPIYERRLATGAIIALPSWVTSHSSVDEDYAIANIGQAKRLFDFEITNSLSPDTDSDGLTDEDELALNTNPGLSDTDGDGASDADEQNAGTDPTDPASTPAIRLKITTPKVLSY